MSSSSLSSPDEQAAGDDHLPDATTGATTTSFTGRLNLSQFAFQGSTRSGKRYGSATATPEPSSADDPDVDRAKSAPVPSVTKRKAAGEAAGGRSRKKGSYAPPSAYAHLPLLPDVLDTDLICMFVGLNPGIETARSGHAYAHPSNLFWKLLHSSGCTSSRLKPEEDGTLPARFALGYTNIVSRPTRNGGELSKGEMDASVAALEDKIRRWRPQSVCLVGKSIWESIFRVKQRRALRKDEFQYGWQTDDKNMGRITVGDETNRWAGARVFVATSTSGLAASLSPAEKERIWRELGVWVEERRIKRGLL